MIRFDPNFTLSLDRLSKSPWELNYAYDAARRLDSITAPEGVYDYQYSAGVGSPTSASRFIKKLVLPNSAYITNGFDSVGRVLSTRLKNSSNTELNSHAYTYNNGHQRTDQTRFDGSVVTYAYDSIGQLSTANGKHGATNRWQEQFSYSYDKTGNLSNRVANLFTNTWTVDSLNRLSTYTRQTTNFTVAGSTTVPAISVTVNGNSAQRYADSTFARTNLVLTNGANLFTAIASDSLGRSNTNTVSVVVPSSTSYVYDQNGNLISDGLRGFTYDDENQLVSILVTNSWKSEFTYDGFMRRRVRAEYTWLGTAWQKVSEIRYIYDGRLALQERDSLNIATVTYTRGIDLSGSMHGAGGVVFHSGESQQRPSF